MYCVGYWIFDRQIDIVSNETVLQHPNSFHLLKEFSSEWEAKKFAASLGDISEASF